jgi:hypothetical protein
MVHSDAQLAEERSAADARLREELAHADARLAEEKRAAHEAEQLAEAWAVKVIGVRIPPGENVISTPENPSERPVVIIVNHGRYTITRVDAKFSDGSGFLGSAQRQPYADFASLPHDLVQDVTGPLGEVYGGVVVPGGAMRIIGDSMLVRYLRTLYPIVRWTDRWGTIWEHKQGAVRQVTDGGEWTP